MIGVKRTSWKLSSITIFRSLLIGKTATTFRLRLYPVQNGITIMPGEGMLIEHGEVFLMKFLDRYQQDRRIDIDTHLLIAALQQFAFAESLSEVGCNRYTAFHSVRFVYQLVLGFTIYNREAECILAHTDGESCLLCSFSYQLLALSLSLVMSPIFNPGKLPASEAFSVTCWIASSSRPSR